MAEQGVGPTGFSQCANKVRSLPPICNIGIAIPIPVGFGVNDFTLYCNSNELEMVQEGENPNRLSSLAIGHWLDNLFDMTIRLPSLEGYRA